MNLGLTPEELERKEDAKWEDRCNDFVEKHPEPMPSPEELASPEDQVKGFEQLCASFEDQYPLEDLHKIIDLTPQEAPLHPLRGPAKLALNPIYARLTILKNLFGADTDQYRGLQVQWLRLSHAVGRSRGVIIVHDSPYTPRS